MTTNRKHVVYVTFVSMSLFRLVCEAHSASKRLSSTSRRSTATESRVLCLDGFVSVHLSKVRFADLPSAVYVQDEQRGFFQVTAVANRCHYFLHQTDGDVVVFAAAFHGCFVKRRTNDTSLTLVIMAPAEGGRLEIVESVPLVCERKVKETNPHHHHPPIPKPFCTKHGFNITISHNATVPPLNLSAVRISSNQSRSCAPQKRSKDAVTFSFPFTDCGTGSTVKDGIITYWVNVEVKPRRQQNASIFRDTPFHLTVHCSFALEQTTQLAVNVRGEKSERPFTLRGEGILRTEMRFAKDSSYKSFHSSRGPPAVAELGQPVYVEVFVVKHEGEDLVLLLDDCWATATRNPRDPLRWNLLAKGCPDAEDTHMTVVLPVVADKELTFPSLRKRFVVAMFSFVNHPTPQKQVYFHCDTEICKGPGCSRSCSKGESKLKRFAPQPRQRMHGVVSGGPMLYLF